MMKSRFIPVLLVSGSDLVKSFSFQNPEYLGDPANALRIYSDLGVDELILLDKSRSLHSGPNFKLLEHLVAECFMPVCYGGGINTIRDVELLIQMGFDKVVVNRVFLINPKLVSEMAQEFGSQSILININVVKDNMGEYAVYDWEKRTIVPMALQTFIELAENFKVGEIMVTNVERDGSRSGYDFELLRKVRTMTNVPMIFYGGAGTLEDLDRAVSESAHTSAAASAVFSYYSPTNGILVNYPKYR